MTNRKPRIVVFYGGIGSNHDLSQVTGQWVCQYIPRSKYEVTPVRVMPDGTWKVPLGSLPKTGPVSRTMHMLSQAVQSLAPRKALERLLYRPVDAFLTVVRGKGGDDGSLHSLGQALSVPIIGSPYAACQQTYNKYLFSHAISEIAATPLSLRYRKGTPAERIVEEVRQQFIPPIFVKPASQEGSVGIQYVQSLDELIPAIRSIDHEDDVLIQERLPGTEMSVTMVQDTRGKIHSLPTTVVVPQKTLFYDHMSKRRQGRVRLHTPNSKENVVLGEAQAIARDIYDELGCEGIVTVDMIANDNLIDVLEVNTVPTLSPTTPLIHQLKSAGLHPSRLFDNLIEKSIN